MQLEFYFAKVLELIVVKGSIERIRKLLEKIKETEGVREAVLILDNKK